MRSNSIVLVGDDAIARIQSIGRNYLAKYPKPGALHGNQEIAKALATYQPALSNSDEHKKFLIRTVFKLPKLKGELYEQIQAFCQHEFGEKLKQRDLVRGITPEMIRELGEGYKFRVSFFHGNQASAAKMASYGIAPAIQNPTIEGMWNFLGLIYAELPDSYLGRKGTLEKAIGQLFFIAFNIDEMPQRFEVVAMGGSASTFNLSVEAINENIQKITLPVIKAATQNVELQMR